MNTYLPPYFLRENNFNIAGGSLSSGYLFAIPSYKRIKILKEKTLKTLESYKIPQKDIYLFFANNEELKSYKDEIGGDYNYVKGVPTIKGVRNFIIDYFKEGQKLVCIDDDIKEITKKDGVKVKRLPNLKSFLDKAFQLLEKTNTYMWGVYPVDNGLFMKNVLSFDLRYIISAFYGIINRKDKGLKLTSGGKDDYLKTILYWKKDGALPRFNNIGIKTNYYGDGGLNTDKKRRQKESEIDTKLFERKFPNLVNAVPPTTSNPYWNIRLTRVPSELFKNLPLK